MSDMPDMPSTPAPAAVVEPSPAALFFRDLQAATPRVWVTYGLIAVNVAVFLAMVSRGVGFFDPTGDSVIPWGGNYGPKTLNGQEWRLLSSMFIHFGIIHIGPLVERLLGNFAFAVAYLLAGLFGSLLSVTVHPQIVSAGASGAIFGMYGVLFGFLLMQRGVIPKPVLVSLTKNALIFVGYNVFYASTTQGIDMSAHMGGLGSGLVLGAVLSRRLVRGAGMFRAAIVLVVGLGLAQALANKIPKPVDVDAVLAQSDKVESAAADKYNDSINAWNANKLTDQQMLGVIQDQILPPYSADIDRLNRLKGNEKIDEPKLEALIAYRLKRREQYEAQAAAIVSKKAEDQNRANELGSEADAMVAKL
jgi:rhomboid protease GluP